MKFTDDRVYDFLGPSLIATFVDCPVRHVLRQALLGVEVKNDRAIHPGSTEESKRGPKDSSDLGSPGPHYIPIAEPTSEAMQGRRHTVFFGHWQCPIPDERKLPYQHPRIQEARVDTSQVCAAQASFQLYSTLRLFLPSSKLGCFRRSRGMSAYMLNTSESDVVLHRVMKVSL